MNYYRILNEGLDRYVERELREEKDERILNEDVKNTRSFLGKASLNEAKLDEANPFKAIGNLLKGIKESAIYLFDGKQVSKEQFQSGISFYGLDLTSQQQKNLELGTELKVKGNDSKDHTLQIRSTTTDRTDRKNAKEADKNINKEGQLSDDGKISVEKIKSTNGTIQYALVLGKSKRLTLYPSYDILKQAIEYLINSFKGIKPAEEGSEEAGS